jgi:hypothetical protein
VLYLRRFAKLAISAPQIEANDQGPAGEIEQYEYEQVHGGSGS